MITTGSALLRPLSPHPQNQSPCCNLLNNFQRQQLGATALWFSPSKICHCCLLAGTGVFCLSPPLLSSLFFPSLFFSSFPSSCYYLSTFLLFSFSSVFYCLEFGRCTLSKFTSHLQFTENVLYIFYSVISFS